MSRRFDVVVVGAGPAGSTAALVLARSGARVALADKAAFPRDKACGDLVGPRGVQVLADLGLRVPDAGQGSDLLAVGPSGRRSRLPAFTGRTYPGHGIIVPRLALDHALREAALEAGAVPVRARITAVEAGGDGRVDAVISSDGQRLAGEVIIAADGALSPVARLAGMLDPQTALWGFAIRAYVPAEVPLPLLVLLDASPWRIYPGYGWLFPGENGQANVGIGVGLGSTRRQAPLRGDLARLVAMLGQHGDLGPDARPGPVMGGWLRMGGTGTPPAAGNVLLAGDAAGLINPLQGEGIGPAMVSARLAAEAVLAGPARAGPAYAEAIEAAFGRYMDGASALQTVMLRRPRTTSAVTRLLTAPVLRRVVAGTWSIYWNGLVDGARPRPSAWTAHAVEILAGHLSGRLAGHNLAGRPMSREEQLDPKLGAALSTSSSLPRPASMAVAAGFDPTTPSIARVYDYLLNGKDNFAADREVAERLLAVAPLTAEVTRENRQFLARAVTWAARQGTGNFIDPGCGMPTAPRRRRARGARDLGRRRRGH